MIAAAWIVGSLAAWLFCGYLAGRYFARSAYLDSGYHYAEDDAVFALAFCYAFGPLALVARAGLALVHHSLPRAVPEIAEKDRKQRIAALEAELDAAHRQLGITPLKREAS